MRRDLEHARRGELRGRGLRHVLVVGLADAGRPLTLVELVGLLEARKVSLPDGVTKLVSDALRWELRCGRVRRVRRGAYQFAGAPPSTMRWIRRRVGLLCSLLDEADAHAAHRRFAGHGARRAAATGGHR